MVRFWHHTFKHIIVRLRVVGFSFEIYLFIFKNLNHFCIDLIILCIDAKSLEWIVIYFGSRTRKELDVDVLSYSKRFRIFLARLWPSWGGSGVFSVVCSNTSDICALQCWLTCDVGHGECREHASSLLWCVRFDLGRCHRCGIQRARAWQPITLLFIRRNSLSAYEGISHPVQEPEMCTAVHSQGALFSTVALV